MYGGLRAAAVALPPELALGWAAARFSRKLRQPANIVMAAGMTRVFPAVSELKVSPLVTGITADSKLNDAMAAFRTRLTTHPSLSLGQQQAVEGGIDRVYRFGSWLQGPVDQYGLAWILSGKVTWIMTFCAVSGAARHGMDLSGMLASWGLTGDFQGSVGAIAAAAGVSKLGQPCLWIYGGSLTLHVVPVT